MKAYLLSAGYGTRLRPITDTTPKCLVPIRSQPLLYWWFGLLKRHGVSEVLVNTHYLAEKVREYLCFYNSLGTGLTAVEFYEPVLLGSGGTVRAARDFTGKDDAFLICYADNLTNMNLSAMQKYHRKNGGILTMALFRTDKPKQCGIAALGPDGRITEFEEKPACPKSNLANAGVYVAGREIYDLFPKADFIDFGKDMLPALLGRMYGWETEDYLMDIGTQDHYKRAEREWNDDYNQDTAKN